MIAAMTFITAIWLLFVGTMMTTENMRSFLLFKFAPILMAIGQLFIFMYEIGLIVNPSSF